MTSLEHEGVDRRGFLRGLVTGGFLAAGRRAASAPAGLLPAQSLSAERPAPPGEPLQASLWIAIAEDGGVRIWAHRSEMGTGIRTSLPMVVADELGCDWDKVTLEQALGDKRYGSQNTDGSRSIRRFYQPMREAGAAARMMLEQAAPAPGASTRRSATRASTPCTARTASASASASWSPPRASSPPKPRATLTFRKPEEYRYVGKDEVRFYDLDDVHDRQGEVRRRRAARGHGARGDLARAGARRNRSTRSTPRAAKACPACSTSSSASTSSRGAGVPGARRRRRGRAQHATRRCAAATR